MSLFDAELLRKTGIFGIVSAEVSVLVGGGSWLGTWLDKQWKTAPTFTAGFAVLGLALSLWRIKQRLRP